MPMAACVLLLAAGVSAASPSSPSPGSARVKGRPLDQNVAPVMPASTFDAGAFAGHVKDLETAWKDANSACRREGNFCESAEGILEQLFGTAYYPDWPHFIVSFKLDGDSPTTKVAAAVLVANKKTTPYFFGARDIWIVVISDRSPSERDVTASFVNVRPAWVNPFETLIGAMSGIKAAGNPATVGQPVGKPSPVALAALPTKKKEPAYWVGVTGFSLPEDTVNRVSVIAMPKSTPEPKNTPGILETDRVNVEWDSSGTRAVALVIPPKTPPKTTAAKTPAVESEEAAPARTTGKEAPAEASADANANFSNASASYFGSSIGFGFFGGDIREAAAPPSYAEDQTKPIETTKHKWSGYVFGKIYVLPPRVNLRSALHPYRPSVAVVAGTNLSSSPLDDLAVGISVGHLFSRMGVMVGYQHSFAKTDTSKPLTQAADGVFGAIECTF